MILRARFSVRFKGRRLTPRPTTTLEGLSHLLVTGSFHRWIEDEILPAGEAVRKFLESLPPGLKWNLAHEEDVVAPEAQSVDLTLSGTMNGQPVMVTVLARSHHPRGRPGLVAEVTAVAVSPDVERSADLQALARKVMKDPSRQATFGHPMELEMESLSRHILAVLPTALPVESVQHEVESGAVTAWPDHALATLPVATAAWLTALTDLARSQPSLFGDVLAPTGDFAGWLDDGADAGTSADGGGSFGSAHGADVGGGHLG